MSSKAKIVVPEPLATPDVPKVLAIVRGKTWPRTILATTLDAATNTQFLHVLTSATPTSRFVLTASVPMLSGASVPAIGAGGQRVQTVPNGTGLVGAPAAILAEYAAALAYPKPAAAPDVDLTDALTTGLRTNAVAQVASFKKLATLTQSQKVVGAPTAFRLADGSALVFGQLVRTDTITAAAGAKTVGLPAPIAALLGKTTIAKSVVVTSLETVVLVVPTTGKATVIGADDQPHRPRARNGPPRSFDRIDLMTQEPIAGSAGRGAVDLSGLSTSGPAAGAGAASGASGAGGAGGSGARRGVPAGLVIEATDATFTSVVNASLRVPSVVVMWSPRLPQTADYVDLVTRIAADLGGRLQVVVVDADANPALLRAFQVQSVPVTIGLVQGQPVPLFRRRAARGRRPRDHPTAAQARRPARRRRSARARAGRRRRRRRRRRERRAPPLHQQAFDAIQEGDFDGATAEYEQAMRQNPNDHEAQLGLAQVGLLRRTAGVDLQQARAAAASDPTDIDAALTVADLDVLGGHIEDAFGRLLDLVRNTAGDDRDRVRTHLIALFAVVGNHDKRVKRGPRH